MMQGRVFFCMPMQAMSIVVPPWFIVLLTALRSSSKRGAKLPTSITSSSFRGGVQRTEEYKLITAVTGLPVGV
jgi:hypothetical protein